MITIKILFWIFLFVVFYAYIGYGILLFFMIRIKRFFKLGRKREYDPSYAPEVTLFVAAYNEKDYVEAKVKNSFELDYPQDKIKQVWVTDGSDDGTPDMLRKYKDQGVEVYHENVRGGKIGAMNRGMQFVKSPIVIFF